jgi:hypothetical protein
MALLLALKWAVEGWELTQPTSLQIPTQCIGGKRVVSITPLWPQSLRIRIGRLWATSAACCASICEFGDMSL